MQVLIKLEESKGIQDSWTVAVLRKSLQQYITISTNAHRYDVNARAGNVTNSRRLSNFNVLEQGRVPMENQASGETLVTNTSMSINFLRQGQRVCEATRPCIFCGGSHFNDCCTEYTDMHKRKKQLQKQGRCFVCLKGGHIFKEVPMPSQRFVIIAEILDIIEVFAVQSLKRFRRMTVMLIKHQQI